MRMVPATAALLAVMPLAVSVHADQMVRLEDDTDRASYSLGYQMGQDLKRQGVTLERDALIRGLRDGQAGTDALMPADEIQSLLTELKRRIVADLADKRQAESAALKQAGIDFLEQNKTRPGVQVTESGLQYKVIEEGTGERPGPTDRVRVHYVGRTVEDQQFDSSYRRGEPAEFALNGVIKGWSEGLQLMREGAKYELYIPYQLAYNARGPLAFQALIFEVELLAVNPEDEAPSAAAKEAK